jgi:hypothetical protein
MGRGLRPIMRVMKYFVALVFVGIFASLAFALYFMLKDGRNGRAKSQYTSVYRNEPHHVHEVPVPGRALEAEVAVGVKWPFIRRSVMNSSISMPMITWKPWKPVSMKKVEP